MEFGGDGIYAAAKLLYQEPAFKSNKIGKGNTPIAEELQKNIMNFTTNQETNQERMIQVDALMNTLKHFGDKI